ncbi:HtaA domain-containing protein [Streptomyces aurantiogriseus]|uniref:Htaa domain-containing protein n=1 Tax=Streptomyces aurantiogriseus TaxID=66870 RepID=A0A918CD21_9ACTN|nr:HtaA domain-containing protein [Streptomyces aurantiogriseus]GGR18003.1 hypothetical protein GCM10010251_37610 [Streptomyces aurantiogriseus]
MAKKTAQRPGAVALAAGALFALCCPAAAVAQDRPEGEALPSEVSGGNVNWSASGGELTGRGVSLGVTAPAVRAAGDRASFPALGGGADPESGTVDLELGGAARFDGPADRPLVLAGLRLELAGEEGALYARTVVDGRADELALAEVTASGAGPVVRTGGVTWTGLRASLTEEGAALLSSWSGSPFVTGDGLGVLDVTAGTAEAAPETPRASPGGEEQPQSVRQEKPTAAVAHTTLTAGAEQTVTGTGFAPGAVVLVAIDGDTRYQAVADAGGRVARTFPVYTNAAEGEHTVELTAVSGEQGAVSARFGVGAPN